MIKGNRIHVATGVALATAAIAIGFVISYEPSPGRSRRAASTPPALDLSDEGMRREYELSWLSDASLADGTPLASLHTRGSLSLTAVRFASGDLAYRGELTELELSAKTGDENGAKMAEEQFGAERNAPFFLLPDAHGRLRGLLVPTDQTESLSSKIRRSVVAALQPIRNPSAQGTWQLAEQDTNGQLIAAYSRLSPQELVKSVVRYETFGTADKVNTERMFIKVSGRTSLRYGEAGVLETIRRDDTLTFETMDKRFIVRTRLAISERGRQKSPLPSQQLAGLRLVPLFMVDAPAKSATRENALATKSVDEQWQSLENSSSEKRWSAYEDLKAHFEHDPSAMDPFVQRLLPGDVEGSASQLALAAIADTETPEAQQRLVEIARTAESDFIRQNALKHAALIPKPTRETLDDLQALAEGGHADPMTQKTSLLALGAVAGNAMRLGDPESSAAADGALSSMLAQFRATDDASERDLVLRALGNSGDPKILDALLEETNSSRPGARPAAIEALRLVADPRVDATLLKSLDDPDDDVRLSALEAARYRDYTPALQESLLRALEQEEQPQARMAALTILGNHAGESSEIARALQRLSESDPTQMIREQARGYVADLELAQAQK